MARMRATDVINVLFLLTCLLVYFTSTQKSVIFLSMTVRQLCSHSAKGTDTDK
jgi:hypothetical protein